MAGYSRFTPSWWRTAGGVVADELFGLKVPRPTVLAVSHSFYLVKYQYSGSSV
jgi:hypothetical protein